MSRFFSNLAACCAFAVLTPTLHAQDKTTAAIKADLEKAQAQLLAQRDSQSAERRELSQKITSTQEELLTKRRQADLSRRSISDQDAYLRNLRTKEYASSAEVESLSSGLRSYGMQLHTRRFPGEPDDARFDSIFKKDADDSSTLEQRFAILELGIERLENALSGSTYSASVSLDDAKLVTGQVMEFGPVLMFQSDDKTLAGSYLLSRSAQVASLESDDQDVAKALFAGQEATTRIDITGGKARALAEIKSNPIELVKKGGAWVYPIIILAFAALFCALKKMIELRTIKDPDDATIQSISEKYCGGNIQAAISEAESLHHPIAVVLPETIDAVHVGNLEAGEEVLYERLITVRESLRRWLPFITVTAAVAPLLGLLGTVSRSTVDLWRNFRGSHHDSFRPYCRHSCLHASRPTLPPSQGH